jgi:hypothetical protein
VITSNFLLEWKVLDIFLQNGCDYKAVENLDIFEKILCARRKFGFNKKNCPKLTWFYSGSIFLQRKFSIFLRNNHVCKVFVQNKLSRQNKKTDTTAQLYCTLSMYVTLKTISRQNQKN